MESSKDLTPQQVWAIKKSLQIGEELIKNNPEIADMYRSGHSQAEIVENLSLAKKYSISDIIARVSVSNALRGYEGHLEEILDHNYEGLLGNDELDIIKQEHNIYGGEKGGKASLQKRRDNRIGIHGLSTEQLSENGKRGGKKCYQDNIGIHSLTKQEIIQNSRKGTAALGFVNWMHEEQNYLMSIASDGQYQHQKGRHKGKPDYIKITEELNKVFHEGESIRTKDGVRTTYVRLITNIK
jgi:hypothetical protein